MKKRIISSLLLAAMLASLAACGGDDTDKDNGDKTVGEETPAGIEAADYGKTFTIYAPDFGMYQRYFFADDPGTDSMTKALYEREVKVEEHLGVDIKYTLEGDIFNVRTEVQEMVMTGDDTYQLMLTHCIAGLSAMVTENLLYDFNNFEYVDMSADWWNQAANEALNVNGHCYYTVSDYMLADPNCILFNKEILNAHNLEDPYQLVRDGEWTIDKMMEMMSSITTDNGDGKWDYSDTWGLATPNDWFLNSFIFSSEVDFVSRDSDDQFIFAFDNERTYTMIEKLDQLLTGSDTYVYDDMGHLSGEECFAEDTYVDISKERSLFNINTIRNLYLYRDADVDFGILPYPKLEASQAGYVTNDWSGLMCVPKTVGDPEMVGKVIELLAYFSEDTKYAYYEIMLGEKLSRDPESKEMLDIIFDGIMFDPGVTYFGFDSGMKQFFYIPGKLILDGHGSAGLASHIASYKTSVEAVIEQFNEDVASIADEE